jgi:hypothetical protein
VTAIHGLASLIQLAYDCSMVLIAQIALGVIIGGLTLGLLATGFYVWNSRQKNEQMAIGLFAAGAVIVVVLIVLVASQ